MAGRIIWLELKLVVLEKAFLVSALTVMLIINLTQIFGRNFGIDQTGKWTDLMMVLLPWLGMIGAAVAMHHGSHVGFQGIRSHVPPAVRKVMFGLATIGMVTFFVMLMISGLEATREQYDIGGVSPQMGIPRWVSTVSVPIGGALMIVHALVGLRRAYVQTMHGETLETAERGQP